MTYTVALIGLGGIGWRYDVGLPENNYALSHARAFKLHPDFNLLVGIDASKIAREEFQKETNIQSCGSYTSYFSENEIDIVVIATPTETHLQIVDQILLVASPKLIFCEKPVSNTFDDASAIANKCAKKNTKLYVNYIRRADPAVLEVRNRIASGDIIEPYKAVIWYSKGLLHSGTHFLDLMIFWFGPVISWSIISTGVSGNNRSEPDILLKFKKITAIFCSASEGDYSHFSVEIIARNGRLSYQPSGRIFWQKTGFDSGFAHDKRLLPYAEEIPSDMNYYQYRIASEISLAMKNKLNVLCDGSLALENVKILTNILDAVKKYVDK